MVRLGMSVWGGEVGMSVCSGEVGDECLGW